MWKTIFIEGFFSETKQGSQYRSGGCIGLTSGMIYFGYQSIPVYRFGFTAIFYYFI